MNRGSVIALLLFAGCGGDDAAQGEPGEGTLAVSFSIDADWQAAMEEPALGTFHGGIFLTDEVTALGPEEGAEPLELVTVLVDLTGGSPTPVLYTTGALSEGWVDVLGFLDSDGNVVPGTDEPDAKDPVTLPADNEFQVVADAETPAQVHFGLLNP
jgi:hypothetical protein